MAITVNTDLRLVNELVETGYTETVTQAVTQFFEGSRGAVIKDSVAFVGDSVQHNYLKEVGTLISRRINQGSGSDAAATSLKVEEASDTVPRLARKIGPVDVALGALRARGMSPEALSLALGQQIAKAEMADQINAAAASLVGAISAKTGAFFNNTVTAITTKTMTYEALVNGLALMGDAGTDIVAWVMHSKAFYDLVKLGLTPANAPDQVGSASIFTGIPGSLGRPIIVTDAPALKASTDYWSFGLREGAVTIKVDDMPLLLTEPVTGRENLLWRIQGELDYICRVLGYRYTDSGKNPANTALATTANWALDGSTIKHAAGIAIKTK